MRPTEDTYRHKGLRKKLVQGIQTKGITDERVLDAILEVPRHFFLDSAFDEKAYEDRAFPIGEGQTISQPYIVARMTEILRNGKQLNKVLEIGTGCGYQTAILSRVSKEVLSLERIRPLVMKARGHLRTLKCNNVKLDHADGSLGLSEFAPFDGIIVTAAAGHVPQELLAQLAVGGRMVIPIGTNTQNLYLIERLGNDYKQSKLESVKFVPLLGGVSA
jgi:protein-L-isoaspartate(D-aspartate) O-methyltransferase